MEWVSPPVVDSRDGSLSAVGWKHRTEDDATTGRKGPHPRDGIRGDRTGITPVCTHAEQGSRANDYSPTGNPTDAREDKQNVEPNKRIKNHETFNNPHHRKHTADMKDSRIPTPATVTLPMSQYIGAPAIPVVKVGDRVCVGTKIAEADGKVSVPYQFG